MACLIGADEAGYGPNLGPLVITASVWRTPSEILGADLYELLSDVVVASPMSHDDHSRTPIADSKALYKSRGRLDDLERGVLSALRVTGHAPRRWRELFVTLDPGCAAALDTIPWYAGFDGAVPLDADVEQIDRLSQRLRGGLRRAGVALDAICSLVVFPEQFNDLLDRHGNKAALLSALTLELVAKLVAAAPETPILVQCDKHGGRNRYGPLLQQLFPDDLVEVCQESRPLSRYRWGPPSRRVETRFDAKGEQFLPTALASMASKYLRELAMLAFNTFWRRSTPELKPTAGYPGDAGRFQAEIRQVQAELGIGQRTLWRNR